MCSHHIWLSVKCYVLDVKYQVQNNVRWIERGVVVMSYYHDALIKDNYDSINIVLVCSLYKIHKKYVFVISPSDSI